MLLLPGIGAGKRQLSPVDSMFVQRLNFSTIFFWEVAAPGAVGSGVTQSVVELNDGIDVERGDEFIFFRCNPKSDTSLQSRLVHVSSGVGHSCLSLGFILHVFEWVVC